mmetsp:Transcript_34050/g.33235  ORF Transcript_34050/g.33235 Transcript_34050/m.33235 type:complete len:114 (-) Transcript_34050:1194-1535(-)
MDNVVKGLDYCFTGIFVIEALLKIIAFGFLFNGKKSYLRNYWNILDFFVVTISLASYGLDKFGLRIVKVFRILRVLKPLRVISRNEGLKLSLNSLFVSISALMNLVLISIVFM